MLIWGGEQLVGSRPMADGLSYTPAGRQWSRIPTAPLAPRSDQSAVWTGRQMIVWGGQNTKLFEIDYGDGAAYDPARRRWTALPQSPLSPRAYHSAVWTGSQMILWGGGVTGEQEEVEPTQVVPPGTLFGDGAAFDPATNQWSKVPKAPIKARSGQVAVWTGSEMIVWGGAGIGETNLAFNDGAAYDPSAQKWRRIAKAPLSAGFGYGYTGVWTGKQMVIWGGPKGEGAAYDPAQDAWTRLRKPPFKGALILPQSVWTGHVVLLWGGNSRADDPSTATAIGVAYDPATNTWRPLPQTPGATGFGQTAVWTGRDMLVWGGFNAKGRFFSGVDYQPPRAFLP